MNWIQTYNLVPPDLCQLYLDMVAISIESKRIEEDYRRCLKLELRTDDELFKHLRTVLGKAFELYKKDVPNNGNLNFCTHVEVPNLLRYETNGADRFHLHADNWNAKSALRQVGVVLYLDDSDGMTIFPFQKKVFVAKAGQMLLFPAFFTHPHQADTPVVSCKTVITTWYCYPPDNGHYATVAL